MEHLDNSFPWLPAVFSHLNSGIFAFGGFFWAQLKPFLSVLVLCCSVLVPPSAGQGWLGVGDLSCAAKDFNPPGMVLME